jgi:hypothetical protein
MASGGSGFDAVGRRLLAHMEADFGFLRGCWGIEERLDFAPNSAEGGVVLKKSGVNLGEAFKDIGLSHEEFALFHEGANNENAHAGGLGAFKKIGGHEGPVLGESEGCNL